MFSLLNWLLLVVIVINIVIGGLIEKKKWIAYATSPITGARLQTRNFGILMQNFWLD